VVVGQILSELLLTFERYRLEPLLITAGAAMGGLTNAPVFGEKLRLRVNDSLLKTLFYRVLMSIC